MHAECDQEQRITAAVSLIVEQRAVIEQAKGMLMLVYGIDADAAFDVMRWQSQQYNVKLRIVAERIARDFVEHSRTTPPRNRSTYDKLLAGAYRQTSGMG